MDQVQIPIERNDDSWRQRCNDRVERLKAQQFPSSQEEFVGQKYSLIFKLEKAVQNGNVDSFVNVLGQVSSENKLPLSAIFDQVTPAGNSLLHEAAYFGREDIAELIGHHFPELLTKRNIKGDTALHVAARAKVSDVMKVILSTYVAEKSKSPFDNNKGITRFTNEYGNTALHEAVYSKHHDGVTLLFVADKSVAHYLNKSGESPLYLAVLSSDKKIVDVLLKVPFPDDKPLPKCHGNSPLHAAIYTENAGLIKEIVEKKPELMYLRDEDGGTPLHYAATRGYVEGVLRMLSSKSGRSTALEWNAKGHLPIHLACKWGHVKVVKEFLEQEWLNSRVLLNKKGQNILHIAAKNGRDNVVKYLLRNTKLMQQQLELVNEKDRDGNTPLHLASQNFYPNILFSLSRDKRIDVNLMNNRGLTPRDILWRLRERTVARRQSLSDAVLRSVGARISDKSRSIFLERKVPPKQDWIKDRANTLMLVAMLIVTVTFAAGFTVPGGVYSSDDPNPYSRGMPVLDKRSTFQIFVLFNTVAMYSSTFGCFLLLWTLGDFHLAIRCYVSAIIMVGVALVTMTLAFMATVGLFVSNVSWLATVITIIGFIFLSLTLSISFVLGVFPHGVGIPFMHPVSELHIRMSISFYGSPPKIKKPSASQQEQQE